MTFTSLNIPERLSFGKNSTNQTMLRMFLLLDLLIALAFSTEISIFMEEKTRSM
jgi:hypothetical protein